MKLHLYLINVWNIMCQRVSQFSYFSIFQSAILCLTIAVFTVSGLHQLGIPTLSNVHVAALHLQGFNPFGDPYP